MVAKNTDSAKSKAEATEAVATPEIAPKGRMARLLAPLLVLGIFLALATVGVGTGYEGTKFVFCKKNPEEAICVRM